ncbi:MAG: hypothetical protein D3905_16660, partial [Candidatus Electrothrix sp. AS4_5]|nr:hypothetical protein [Candidatus Electrothrix gigas]
GVRADKENAHGVFGIRNMLPANTGWSDWILLDVMQGNKGESSCSALLPVAFHVFLHYDQQVK